MKFDRNCKLFDLVSTDPTRDTLHAVRVLGTDADTDSKFVAVVTNGHAMAVVPVQPSEGEDDPSGTYPAEIIKAAIKLAKINKLADAEAVLRNDGKEAMLTNGAVFPIPPQPGEFGFNYESLIPCLPSGHISFAIDVGLLMDLLGALGSTHSQCVLSLPRDYDGAGPIRVSPCDNGPDYTRVGVIMPMRK